MVIVGWWCIKRSFFFLWLLGVSRTPLMMAAASGHTDCVKLLLRHGASVCVVDNNQRTTLFHAVSVLRIPSQCIDGYVWCLI